MSKQQSYYRTHQYLIKQGHPLCSYFLTQMKNANNLYNATQFHIRQVYTALSKETETLHPLQEEVLKGLQDILPEVNKQLKEKHKNLCAKDLLEHAENLKTDPTASLKTRKTPVCHEQPTSEHPFISYNTLDAYFKGSENVDYYELPAHVNQHVMKQVYQNWNSYFQGLKLYKQNPSKYTGMPRPPKYKTKGGFTELTFSNQVCLIKKEKNGKCFLTFPKTKTTFNLSKHLGQQVASKGYTLAEIRVQKWYDDVKLEVVLDCTKHIKPLIPEEQIKNILAIDIGVNNLCACVSNHGMKPVLINGKPLKAINQYYNKQRAHLYGSLRLGKNPKEGTFTTPRLEKLDKKRWLQIKDYMHKASHYLVQLAVKNNIHQVIIGYNQGWKTDIQKLSKGVKQTFVAIPFSLFLELLAYKLHAEGIHFKTVEESYTSQASFIDKDTIPTYGDKVVPLFSGKRIQRGLYRTQNGLFLNSDLNGACNILRKHTKEVLDIPYKLLTQVEKVTLKRARKTTQSVSKGSKNQMKKQGTWNAQKRLAFKTPSSTPNSVGA